MAIHWEASEQHLKTHSLAIYYLFISYQRQPMCLGQKIFYCTEVESSFPRVRSRVVPPCLSFLILLFVHCLYLIVVNTQCHLLSSRKSQWREDPALPTCLATVCHRLAITLIFVWFGWWINKQRGHPALSILTKVLTQEQITYPRVFIDDELQKY